MSGSKCKIIFFGTPEFALPALNALIESSFVEVALVVTQPDKPVGRHHSTPIPSPIKKLAIEHKLKVRDSLSLPGRGQGEGWGNADFGIVVAYGEILPKKILDSFPPGVLNIHPSLLPKYRGPSPIQAAILNRDKETGVTIIKLDEKMDHGPIVAQKETRSIASLQNITAGELHDILALTGANLLVKILPDYVSGKITPQPQNHADATYTEKLSKESGKIDWSKSPEEIDALVRAMNPWPGAWTIWKGKRLIVWKAGGRGGLQLKEVQLEGKKRMAFAEFRKGHSDFDIADCL